MILEKVSLIGLSTIELPLVGLDHDSPFVLKSGFLRDQLIGPLMSTAQDLPLTVALSMSGLDADLVTTGHIKNFEEGLFNKDPIVQLTISCFDSILKSAEVTQEVPGSEMFYFTNRGNAKAGFYAEFEVTFDTPTLTVMSEIGDSGVVNGLINLDYDFTAGDIIVVDTRPGTRKVTRDREDDAFSFKSLLNNMSSDSTWVMLPPGDNRFGVDPFTGGIEWRTFEYTDTYWGI
jgi:hypothetical protein